MVYTKISPWTFRILKIQVLRYQEVHTPASFIHMILLSPTLRCHSANLVTRIALRSVKASRVHKCTIRSCVLWKLKFVCFVFHAFQPCNLSMRHSAYLYILECTPDLVSVIHLDSYSNCENSIGSTCLWHFDHQVFKAPQSLVGGFTLHKQTWSYQRFTKKTTMDHWLLVSTILTNCVKINNVWNHHQNHHLEEFSCFTPSQTPSLCPFSTPSRRADVATTGQIIHEEILKTTCILIRWALEPTAGQLNLVPNPFVCCFYVFFIGEVDIIFHARSKM